MKRIRGATLAAVFLVMSTAPALAQEAVDVEATIGLQGYVVPNQAATVTAIVTADVLFVGELQVAFGGGVSLFTEIEVPAGSSKEYTFDVPGAGSTSRGVVRLYADGAEEHLAERAVTVLTPGSELLVGVVGAPALLPTLAETTSMPFGGPLNVLELTAEELLGDLAPLAYMVIADGALNNASPEALDNVELWVKDGGRIVGEVQELGKLGLQAGVANSLTDDATVADLGSGELIVVNSLASVSEWGFLLRDQPPHHLGTNDNSEFMGEMGFQMIEAASSSSESVTPDIPWLLGALGLYVLFIGPINFIVLKRIGRRELAWVTIPALSVIMLSVLWVVGRSQLDNRLVTHASVVVQDGDNTRATTTMIVVAGGEGEHTIDVAENWTIAPVDLSRMFGNGGGMQASVSAAPGGGTRMGFELANLGAATVSTTWRPEPIAIRAEVVADGDKLSATIHNDSQLSFWSWGIGSGAAATAATEPLVSGTSEAVVLRAAINQFNEGGSAIAEAVMSQRRWDQGGEDDWRRVWPLAETMARQEPDVVRDGPYFFGYTDGFEASVAVDGSPIKAGGPTLIVIPLDVVLPVAANPVGEIVRISGANFVDAYPGWLYASGADSVEVKFTVAAGTAGEVKLLHSQGMPFNVQELEVFNWGTGEFDRYDWPGNFAATDYISPTNELMVRLFPGSNDFEMPTNALTIAVGAP